MKKILILVCIVALPVSMYAQTPGEVEDTTWKKTLRESYPKTNELVHTKLDVRFDYEKAFMYSKEWLTLKPHFYATDSVLLDAKGMEVKEVAVIKGTVKMPLKYTYDGMQVNIKLDKTYMGDEKYTLYFDYVSKPNELQVKGSQAITDAKGVIYAVNVAKKMNDPFILDTFHDALVEGGYYEDLKI